MKVHYELKTRIGRISLEDDAIGNETFYYGAIGWIVGICFSLALLWAMFGFADPL